MDIYQDLIVASMEASLHQDIFDQITDIDDKC